MPPKLTNEQAHFAANLARDAKARMGLSYVKIADKAGYNERTIRDVLSGKCLVYGTVSNICTALGINLEASLKQANITDACIEEITSRLVGGYSKNHYGRLAGSYMTIRPAYHDLTRIKCYRTVIEWDPGIPCLRFTETDRSDVYGHSGQIYIPPASAFMYLMTIDNGWIRTVLVSVNNAHVMRGLILSQYNLIGANYAPVCAPIIYIKQQPDDGGVYGEFGKEDGRYKAYAQLLWETISKSFVKIAIPSAHDLGIDENAT